MRSYLFVPADDARKLAKGTSTRADALILDLEDSVSPARKADARAMAADFIANAPAGGPKLYVRDNPLTSGMAAADLEAVMPARPFGILQPKARSANDAVAFAGMIGHHEQALGIEHGTTRLLVLITEMAAAVLALTGYDAVGKRLAGLTWGAEDLGADLGSRASRDDAGAYTAPYAQARAMTMMAAASAGVPALDTVYPDFRNSDGFARDCREAVRDGFSGRLAIHPAQVAVINDAFTPSDAEIARATAIVAAFSDADAGVASLDGQMLDRPHFLAAQRLLARAGLGEN